MPKVYLAKKDRNHTSIQLWCNGCRSYHSLSDSKFRFDGNFECPTIIPDVVVEYGSGRFCHFTVTQGKIEYALDCYHQLAGHTVPMTELK